MKVFVSWSGRRSKAMAGALKDWLPLILQYAEPWVSDKDIGAGDRWAQAISGELESSNFGILCITPENLNSQWILFEAGALSKSMQDSKVIPLLFGLELSDLSGPLSQFQAIKVDQQGMLDVAKAINNVVENKTAEATIDQLVPALWPQLESKLSGIPDKEEAEKHMRPQTEILEDLVSQVRGLSTRMKGIDVEIMERDARIYRPTRKNSLDLRMVEELMHFTFVEENSDLSLVIIAGFLREQMPWISELLVEARRDLKQATPDQAREIARELSKVVEVSLLGPWGERMFAGSKSGKYLAMELPHVIERAISLNFKHRRISDGVDAPVNNID